jgi:hypothetical protein
MILLGYKNPNSMLDPWIRLLNEFWNIKKEVHESHIVLYRTKKILMIRSKICWKIKYSYITI